MKICGLIQEPKKKIEIKRNRAGENGEIIAVKTLLKKSNRTLFCFTMVSFPSLSYRQLTVALHHPQSSLCPALSTAVIINKKISD